MRWKAIACAGLVLASLLCGCATADTFHAPGIDVASMSTHTYQCEGGKSLERAFPRFADDFIWWIEAAKAQRARKAPPY